MLFRPEVHERLDDEPWDERRVRAAIRALAADAERACDPDALWPAHEWDVWGSIPPLTGVYAGAAGVIWALGALRDSGYVELDLDLVRASRRSIELVRERLELSEADIPLPVEARSSLWSGETGVLLVAWLLEPRAELADRIHELVVANARNGANELMWGSPGTMLAARLLADRTAEPRWQAAWEESAGVLRARRDEEDLWTQDLYGHESRLLGPAHGLAGIVRALLQGGRDEGLVRGTADVLARTAVVEDGLANWPPAAGSALERDEGIRLQWCHGAPGIVATLPDVVDEDLLLAGAELTWRAGPLGDEKGVGVCHGTAGNGFALLKAFGRTGEEAWLERARRFAVHALAQADRPPARYSLFTGGIGAAVFAARCLEARPDFPTIDSWN